MAILDPTLPQASGVGHSFSGSDIRVIVVIPGYSSAISAEETARLIEQINGSLENGALTPRQANEAPGSNYEEATSLIQAEDSLFRQITLGQTRFVEIGNLNTVSVSTYREKRPVRALGFVYAKGYTRSTRTIAGSMVFTVLDKGALREVLLLLQNPDLDVDNSRLSNAVIADQIPPLNLIIIATNEYGQAAKLALYGVEFFNEGIVFSIDDIMTESTIEFTARHIEPFTNLTEISESLAINSWNTLSPITRIETYLSNPLLKQAQQDILGRAINPDI